VAQSELDAVRALLGAKSRPVGWEERRRRIEEVGLAWPIADDIKLDAVDLDGVRAEWSIAPGADPSRALMFFHGGGYCSGSILSHRRMATEAGRAGGLRALAVGTPASSRGAARWRTRARSFGVICSGSARAPGSGVRPRLPKPANGGTRWAGPAALRTSGG
jgi:hypothetical protein